MNWRVGTKIAASFGALLVVFAVVSAASYRGITRLIETSDLRRHTYEVLVRLTEMELLAAQIQSSIRGYTIAGMTSELDPYQAAVARTDRLVQEVRKLIADNPRQVQRLAELEPLIKNRLDFAREAIEAVRDRGPEAGAALIRSGKGQSLSGEIRRIVDQMQAEEEALLRQRSEAAEADAGNAQWIVVAGTFVALALAALAGFAITRDIAWPLRELTAVAERITVGDLNVSMAVDSRSDEVGVLTRAFDRMTQFLRAMAGAAERIAAGDLRSVVQPQSPDDILGNAFARMSENLREQIRGLVEGANVLGSAAGEIVASTAQLASSASESAAAVSETTTTVEEVRQTAQVASQKSRQVSESAQKVAQVSLGGRKSVEDVVAGMGRIRGQMEAIAASMARLSEQGQAIGQIIATVEDLAAQSNLLAVNAAIEAAKAGEQGKGFGVVAQEVRSLAEQSRQATAQVRAILADIQKATAAAVMATEQGVKAVEAGVRQSEVAGEAIQALAGSVAEAAQAATQIAASSQQQLVGMEQVAAAMDNIKQASAQNVASAQQLESAARNLNELGQRLKQMVERYRV
jgi:methyl-accepting chemotaxis protein